MVGNAKSHQQGRAGWGRHGKVPGFSHLGQIEAQRFQVQLGTGPSCDFRAPLPGSYCDFISLGPWVTDSGSCG